MKTIFTIFVLRVYAPFEVIMKRIKKEDSIGYLIRRTSVANYFHFKKLFDNASSVVTPEQWSVLLSLWGEDGVSQSVLAERSQKERTSLIRVLNNMERNNLIVRVPDKTDKRNKLIYLTRFGKSIEKESYELAKRNQTKAVKGIPKEDLEVFKNVINKIYDNLKIKK